MANKKSKVVSLPLLITRALVLYPGNQQLIEAGREFSINAINLSRLNSDSLILLTSQINSDTEDPTVDEIYKVGTLCHIISCTTKEQRLRVRVEVISRVKLTNISISDEERTFIAQGALYEISPLDEIKNSAIVQSVTKTLENLPGVYASLPKYITNMITKGEDALGICYALAGSLPAPTKLKQDMLERETVDELLNDILLLINGEKTKNQIEHDIAESVRESSEKNQREYFLREKLKAIKKELGETSGAANSPEDILEKLENNPYPEHVKAKVKAELAKFDMMPGGSLEGALIQSYLDVIMNVPWYQKTEDNDDLINVEKILDEDHYGLENPKKRIIEYLAVKKLTGNLKSPILCFYGPPGTGKTSLGKSIARALGRKFFKAALGGISDEAEIRGHRRTYVGSMPGRIIQGMRKAGVTNPVFLLDEVDKLASSYKGDPASALLEVLDPEQNTIFNDNYLEEPYDLSDVLFICTANSLANIPGPLRDRLELIELSSYTELEKLRIAVEHLYAKQLIVNGLTPDNAEFTEDALTFIIRKYTREAGVRDLERKIAACLRKVAVTIVKDPSTGKIIIDEAKVREYLGVPIFDEAVGEKKEQIGVVTGLAYTEYGGATLPIEVNYFKGKGGLVLTGNLGAVMKESASIALDYVKSNAEHFGIKPELFMENDIHIHCPEGAVPKDGPSAGVAISIAIISCLSGVPVNPNVAMTGEVTLRGNALPIGGLREKSLAALRHNIKTIIIPKDNKKDAEELPKEVKDALTIVFMNNVDDAVEVALMKK